MPMRSATTEEFPVAMLPNGPVCTRAGVFSSVCSRFGCRAWRSSTVIGPAAEPDDDVPQRPVVHVEHSPPRDVVRVYAELIAVVQVAVEHRGELVMRRGDRMHVPGQVEV